MMHAPAGSVPGIPTFCADNEAAMRVVVKHLKSLGHERIAFAMDPVNEHTVEGRARGDAFMTAALAAGLAPEILVATPECHEVAQFINDTGVTAFACFSDTLAGRLLRACDELSIDVPGDLSVIGFDSSSFCDRTKPRLTSVRQPVEQMARMATNHLLTLIREVSEGKPSTPTVSSIYDCGLDVRESTSVPRTHRRVHS
jgi:LacI family transcriptional regulator